MDKWNVLPDSYMSKLKRQPIDNRHSSVIIDTFFVIDSASKTLGHPLKLRYDTLRYDRLTFAQKLTRGSA